VTTFAVPIVVRTFEWADFDSDQAMRDTMQLLANAQVLHMCRANRVIVVCAENERVAEMLVNRHCKENHVHAIRIDRPIKADTL
jgi:hypothetical protein